MAAAQYTEPTTAFSKFLTHKGPADDVPSIVLMYPVLYPVVLLYLLSSGFACVTLHPDDLSQLILYCIILLS